MDFFRPEEVLLDIEVLPLIQVMEYTMSNDEHVALIQTLVDALSNNPDLFSCLTDASNHSECGWTSDVDRSAQAFMGSMPCFSDSLKSFTTVMIRNIPRKCSQRMLMSDITCLGFGDKVDFVYLPTDISSAKNLGYAFVNFKSSESANEFRGRFHKKHLSSLRGSRAGLSVTFAVIQGLEANVENVLKNASVHRIRNPEYLPLILSKELGRLVPCVMPPHEIERRNSHSSQSSSAHIFAPTTVSRPMRAH